MADDLEWGTPEDALIRIPLDIPWGIAEPILTPNGNGTFPTTGWQPTNLADLPDDPPVKPTLGGVNLVYPGKRHVFSGPPESAKTLAAYIIALLVIRDGGTVILIDFEMGPYDARDRFRELGATTSDFGKLNYIEPEEPANGGTAALLLQQLPSLVVIDAAAGAYSFQALDDEKRMQVEQFSQLYILPFRKAGIATILIDHVVKNIDNRGKYAIGSERKLGGTDVHLGFETVTAISRGNHGLYKIHTHKDRGGYLKRGILAEMSLDSHTDTHQIVWEFKPVEQGDDQHPWMPTKVMEKISRQLALSEEPPSRAQMIEFAGGRQDYARKAIDHLVRLGYSKEERGDRGAKLLTHVRTFLVSEWESDAVESTETRSEAAGLGRDVANREAYGQGNKKTAQPSQPEPHKQFPNMVIPPNPDLIPDGVIPPNPTASPPSGGEEVERDDVGMGSEAHLIPDGVDPSSDDLDFTR